MTAQIYGADESVGRGKSQCTFVDHIGNVSKKDRVKSIIKQTGMHEETYESGWGLSRA